MFEILPNWHPILVHFTVALFTTSFGFYLLTCLSKSTHLASDKMTLEFEIVGRWCLWCAALMTILTVLAGLYAYYTVKHDEPAHMP